MLVGVNFKFKSGDKIAVVGRVASGKTSLLLSIMGELKGRGKIMHSGSVSFAEQTPLIVSGDVRSNITFGLEFDPDYYE